MISQKQSKLHVYVVDAFYSEPGGDESKSITKLIRKLGYKTWFNSEHGLGQINIVDGSTSKLFLAELKRFIKWQKTVKARPDDGIYLILSLHGQGKPNQSPEAAGNNDNQWVEGENVWFAEDDIISREKLFKPLRGKLQPNVIIGMRNCWGGFPGITRVQKKKDQTPVYAFGATLEVPESKQKYADVRVLKCLVSNPQPSTDQVINLVKEINDQGARSKNPVNQYYRVWYWDDDGEFKREPENVKGFKNVKRVKDA